MTQRDTNGRGRKEQPAAQARDRERPDEPKPSKKEQRWAKKAPEMIEIPRSEERRHVRRSISGSDDDDSAPTSLNRSLSLCGGSTPISISR